MVLEGSLSPGHPLAQKQRNRSLRYLKRDRFENATQNEMARYFLKLAHEQPYDQKSTNEFAMTSVGNTVYGSEEKHSGTFYLAHL